MMSWTTTGILILGLMLHDYAGLNSRPYSMAFSLGLPVFCWLLVITFMWMLWVLYKQTVPSFTASLTEVGPDVRSQLRAISLRPRRLMLVLLAAGLFVMAVAVFVAVSHK